MQSTLGRNLLLTAILLLACWLGVRGITADILYVDEYWSLRNSGGDPFGTLGFLGIWERTATLDPGGMGVLYHWLLGAWYVFFGSSIFSVRLFSLVAGLLAIAATARLGKALFSSPVGVYAAAILATSAFFIDYLHEARAYTLIALFTVWAIYSYHRVIHTKQTSVLWYTSLTLSLAALAYTHYVALAIGAVLGVYHLTQVPLLRQSAAWRRWWLTVVAMAIGGMLFLPWLGITLEVAQRGAEDVGRQDSSMNATQIIQNVLHAFSNANLALLLILAVVSWRKPSRRTLLIWLWLVVSLVLVILVNARVPFMVHLRYLMIVWVALTLIAAVGIDRLRQAGIPALLILLAWGAAGIYQSIATNFIQNQFGYIYRAPANGFERALNVLDSRAQDSDLALFHIMTPDFEPFNYFVFDYYFTDGRLTIDQVERMNNSFARGDNDYLLDVNAVLADAPAVWQMVIPDVPTTNKTEVVRFALETQYTPCETVFAQEDMQMTLHVRYPQRAADGNFGYIQMFDMGRGVQTDEQVQVVLGWELENVPTFTYSIGLHLFDANGALVAQNDAPLPNDRDFACSSGAVDVSGLPAGEYDLRVLLYNPATNDRLGDYITIRRVTIGETSDG